MVDALVHPARAAGVFFLFGLLLGWAWARLYPRSLVDRLIGFAVWSRVIVVFSFVVSLAAPDDVGVSGVTLGPGLGWAGVLDALVLVEHKRVSSPTP